MKSIAQRHRFVRLEVLLRGPPHDLFSSVASSQDVEADLQRDATPMLPKGEHGGSPRPPASSPLQWNFGSHHIGRAASPMFRVLIHFFDAFSSLGRERNASCFTSHLHLGVIKKARGWRTGSMDTGLVYAITGAWFMIFTTFAVSAVPCFWNV